MGKSVLVFISHSSEDKEEYIEPIVADLENCFINVWIDKRKILPGDNLRKSIFRDGLDKADIALLFFTEQSLQSSWVDKEIKHVLREEMKKGNDFDLSKIISIFDSKNTYEQISERYPELTDDLLHLMPKDYDKIKLGQLVSAIWSKYLSLQGGDIENQRQLLVKDKEIFQKDKLVEKLNNDLKSEKDKNSKSSLYDEFEQIFNSKKLSSFIQTKNNILLNPFFHLKDIPNGSEARAFGIIEISKSRDHLFSISDKGKSFIEWCLLNDY